jgi:hypothetical protein
MKSEIRNPCPQSSFCHLAIEIIGPTEQVRQKRNMKQIRIIITLIIANMHPAAGIDIIVFSGQSNMQGWQGNGENYPADPKRIDPKVKFYWVTPGHSNSDGKWTYLQQQGGRFAKGHFGPEVTMARLIKSSGCDIAIFKYSLGSTSLAGDWKAPGQNGMYDQMIEELKKSVALLEEQGHTISYKALVWIQGESDAQTKELADGYENRLRLLIENFRTQVAKNEALPIILGVDEQHPWVRAFPQVVDAQQKLAREQENILFTSMIGLEKADSTHLTPMGLEEHGVRLFHAYTTLLAKRPKKQ